jgi:hypothetical protein
MAEVVNFPRRALVNHYLFGTINKILSEDFCEVIISSKQKQYCRAKRCASCLLAPMIGDEVIVLQCAQDFYLTHIVTQKNPAEKILTANKFIFRSQELTLKVRRLFASISSLEAKGHHWLSAFKRSFVKSEETVQHLGHYVLDTHSMHESHETLKILKAPLVIEKTETHQISTEKFFLD